MGGPEMARLITWGPRDGPPDYMGGPKWPPKPPNVRGAPAEPWHPSNPARSERPGEPVALLNISLFRGERF